MKRAGRGKDALEPIFVTLLTSH
eukprot:COSAG01_NODE_1489_length_10133_cov_189.288120_1_plen_22_part_10